MQQQKKSRRLFVGLAGSPLARTGERPTQQNQGAQSQTTVQSVMAAVAVANTNERVKHALQAALDPVQPRRRGRPRVWSSDAERKRAGRADARQKLVQLLGHFGLTPDSEIDTQLQEKFEIGAKTYRELLSSDKVKTALVRAVAKDAKRILKEQRQDQQSTGGGQFMRGAPQGRGKLHSGGYDSRKTDKMKGIRDEQERGLSAPGDFELELMGVSEFKPMGDRRRVRPKGNGPDADDE